MADSEIISRIKYLIKELNFRQTEFAKKIGVDTSNLSKYMNGRLPVSDSLINRIVVNLGVSKEWLEKGTDIPFAKHNSPSVTTVPASEVETISMGTPVYDIDVTAGTMPRARMFSDDLVVGHINLPDIINENCRIVRVSGDSMSPVIRSGDLIAVRELSNTQYIFWGADICGVARRFPTGEICASPRRPRYGDSAERKPQLRRYGNTSRRHS